jgi:hypothetical protein
MAMAIPFIPIALSVASSVLGAVSSAKAGQQAAQGQYDQATATDYQSSILRQNAEAAQNEASARVDALQRKQGLQLGRQQAAAAQSGFLSNTGSLLDVETQSGAEAELNLLNENYQGAMQARGYTNQANLNDFEAARMRANARASRTSGYLGAAGSLLRGGASLGNLFGPTAMNSQNTLGTQSNIFGSGDPAFG